MMMMMMKMMMDGAGDDRWPVITNTRTRVGIAFLLVGPGWVVRLWKLVLFFFFVAHSKLPKNRIHPTGLGDFFYCFFSLIKANFKLFSLLVPSIGKQSKKICFTTFLWILPGFPGFSWILLGYIGFNFVLLSFYRVLLGFIGFYQLLPGFPGFSWILLGYIEFCFVLLNFYRVLLGFIGFYQFLPGFISIYRVLLGFTEFRFIDYFHCQWFGKARTSRVLFLFPFFFAISIEAVTSRYFHTVSKKTTTWGTEKEIDFVSIGAPMGRICFAPPAVVFFLIIWLRPSARNWRHVAAFSGPLRCDDMEIASPALSRRKKKKAEEKKEEKKRYYWSHFSVLLALRNGKRSRPLFGTTRLPNPVRKTRWNPVEEPKKNKPEGDPRRGAGGGRYRLAGEDLRRPANRRPRKKGRPKNRGTPTKRSFFLEFLNETSWFVWSKQLC